MTNKLNPGILKRIIDEVAAKWKETTYYDGVTLSDNMRTWIIADVYFEVLSHIGIHEYDGQIKIGEMNSRRMAELVDMVERHWGGGVRLTEHLVNVAIDDVLEDSRQKGKLRDISHGGTTPYNSSTRPTKSSGRVKSFRTGLSLDRSADDLFSLVALRYE